MKKILVVVLVVAMALIGASVVMAGTAHGTACANCHTPHNAGTAVTLWNTAAVGFDAVNNTMTGVNGSASAASVLCMGCHAAIDRGPGSGAGADMSNDHPLKAPNASSPAYAGVTNDVAYAAQCNTCHDVHANAAYYWTKTCATCHNATHANW